MSWLTRVVPDKGPLNGCVCVCVCVCLCSYNLIVGSWFDFQVTYSKTACHSGWNRWVVRTLICDCVSLHAHVTEISAWSAMICEWKLSDSWLHSSRLLIHSVHWRTYVLPLLLVCFFFLYFYCLQCFDAVGWVAGSVSGLSGQVLARLSVWSEVQTCIWPSWCHCHSLSLASVKSRVVLPFWYRLTQVFPDKGLLNRCVSVCFYIFINP